MFNFFKKLTQELTQTVATDPYLPSNEYPEEIQRIHHEFDTAADKGLAEAQAILKSAEGVSLEKGKRLLALGFKQSREATQALDTTEKVDTAKEIADIIMYFKKEYPFNKFIAEKDVQTICNKYGLVCGPIGSYKGFVPEKNLKQIEAFNLKPKEANCLVCREKDGSFFILENAIIKKGLSGYDHIYKKGSDENYAFQRNGGRRNEEFYANDTHNIFGLRSKGWMDFVVETDAFSICAPLKEMDTKGLSLKGHMLQKEVKDPIVLKRVRGGYLIVTAWGPESSDPLVVNEINN
jgi:hypothetical protein